jgi:cellulose synthase/poly-beta-1,6-N-acetylglucosamine synthase-like glycosyltransferase
MLRRAGIARRDRLRDAWRSLTPVDGVESIGQFVRAVAEGSGGSGRGRQLVADVAGTTPLVSVCVPTFNRVDFLRESLATIVRLDYEPLEILISDNRSDDGTEALCRELEARDRRVRYVRQPSNIGLYGNHNFCIEASRGLHLLFP